MKKNNQKKCLSKRLISNGLEHLQDVTLCIDGHTRLPYYYATGHKTGGALSRCYCCSCSRVCRCYQGQKSIGAAGAGGTYDY